MPSTRKRVLVPRADVLTVAQLCSFKFGWSRPEQMAMSGFRDVAHRREVWLAHRDELCGTTGKPGWYGITPYGEYADER